MRTRKETRMKKYKLEKRDGNEWSLYGIYTERSLPQLVQAAVQLSKTGYEMYGNLHIVEISTDGKTRIL